MSYTSRKADSSVDMDVSGLPGKTAIVTGGADGLGRAYVRALHAAGVNVCIGDLDAEKGEKLSSELPGIKFVRCDVTNWENQVDLFRTAASMTPKSTIDHVVANAGIAIDDEVFSYDGPEYPSRPRNLETIEVSLHGVLYTTKLALHSFMKQNGSAGPNTSQTDTSLTLVGSGAAFLDCPRGVQYQSMKWGARGIMHALRRTAHYHGSRVNMISPWYVRTSILPASTFDSVEKSGVAFATQEDGGRLLLRVMADSSINGRQLFLSPRKWAADGWMDLSLDDFDDGSLYAEIQTDQMRGAPTEEGLFLEGRW